MDEDHEELGDDPAAAFEALRAEVAALRVSIDGAVGRLAVPDYAPTLATIARSLTNMEGHPALRLTPEQHRQAVVRAASGLMREALQTLERAAQSVEREHQQLAGMIGVARDQDRQFRALCWAAGLALVIGLVLSPLVVSVAPFGLNSRFAALVMRDSRWDAGAAMMRVADPIGWARLVDSTHLTGVNEDALKACREAAGKAKKAERCTITVPAN